jgi:methyltransferase (TIGR00027 family)
MNGQVIHTDQAFDVRQLSAVSKTGLLTLWARAIEAQSADPILVDPAAVALVEQLRRHLAALEDPFYQQLVADKLPPLLLLALSLRAQYYDQMARNFRLRFPRGMIINLGAGLDTRFERLDDGKVRVVDLDLPPMIALKRQLITEHPRHELLPASVLDLAWMDTLDRYDDRRFLFLAEGLLMYLPPEQVKRMVIALANRFPGSELVAEVFHARWLRPPLGKWVKRKLQRQFNFDQDAMFQFGLESPQEMAEWDRRIQFVDEWSFLDAHERKLGLYRWFRHIPMLRLIQYNVHYQLG